VVSWEQEELVVFSARAVPPLDNVLMAIPKNLRWSDKLDEKR
jgi:hypothetical protein